MYSFYCKAHEKTMLTSMVPHSTLTNLFIYLFIIIIIIIVVVVVIVIIIMK